MLADQNHTHPCPCAASIKSSLSHSLPERFEMQTSLEDMIQVAKEIRQDTSPDMAVSKEGYRYLERRELL